MAPNLRDRLGIGGVIFHCNKETQAECINHKLFGAPGSHWEHVQHIRKGMPLLLWNMRTRQLIGKFVAASDGAYEIDPAAWTSATGGHKTRFPAQVRVAIVEKCVTLKEAEFKYIIEDSMEGARLPSVLSKKQVDAIHSKFDEKMGTSAPHPNGSAVRPSRQQQHDTQPQQQQQLQGRPNARTAGAAAIETERQRQQAELEERERELLEQALEESRRTAEDDQQRRALAGRPPPPSEQPAPVAHQKIREGAPAGGGDQAPAVGLGTGDDAVQAQLEMCAAAVAAARKEIESLRAFKREAEQEMGRLRSVAGSEAIAKLNRQHVEMRAEIDALKAQLAGGARAVTATPTPTPAVPAAGPAPAQTLQPMVDAMELDARLMIAGGLTKHGTTNKVAIVDPSTGFAEEVAPMAFERSNFGLVNARNGLGVYAIGGGKKMRWFSSVERYDMINNVWVEAPSLLDTRFSGVAAALDDGTIVAAGGGSKKTQLLSSCEVLQPGAAEWVWASNMSETRFASSMVASRGCVWALAGFDGKRYLNTCEFLDPRVGKWQPGPPLLFKRGGHTCASSLLPGSAGVTGEDAIIVAGGFDGTQPISKVECLDLRMPSSWTELPDMGSSRSYGASARLRGVVYTVGGMAATDPSSLCPMTKYSPEQQTWSVGARMDAVAEETIQRYSFGMAPVSRAS